MTDAIPGPAWIPVFLNALAATGVAKHAMQAADVREGPLYQLRNTNLRFAEAWDAALAQSPALRAKAPRAERARVRTGGWQREFLDALAETSNVTAASVRANIPLRTVYKVRRADAEFAAGWLEALHEGYDRLEMELLGYLRDPQPPQKRDVGAALRLLAAHRETVERRRVLEEEDDEQATLDSIDRFLEDMRERRTANRAILLEDPATARPTMAGNELAELLLGLEPEVLRAEIALMSERQRKSLQRHWRLWAHRGQVPPDTGWHTWMIMAGRGYGKTRAGAEWVRAVAENDPTARIALVAATLGEARRVMVEGQSGLLAIARPAFRPRYEPSKRQLTWPRGAVATLYAAGEPESLRGPQHSHAWGDEVAKWDQAGGRAEAAWDNLLLGLRLGRAPRAVATTTPRAVRLVRRLLGQGDAVVTRGTTADNKDNLPTGFLLSVEAQFGRSLLGRQELYGELIDEIEGALWRRALLEECREEHAASCPARRVVIGVDPPASSDGDACGIVVCALGEDGIARVLADMSLTRPTPERWARAVAEAARCWRADRVVAEANNGGEMVRSVLHAAEIALPVRLVHASRGKVARAEPVAALYESGRVRHCGQLPQLEDELCGLMTGGGYEGPGRSPDRADALVWALSELMLERRAEPRVRVL